MHWCWLLNRLYRWNRKLCKRLSWCCISRWHKHLKKCLKRKAKTLKVPPLIGYYEFADLYKKLLEKTQTKEEEASIQRYIAKCLKLLEKEQISFDEQNALDLYMNDYLANKLKTKSEENLFKRYNDIIKINKSRMLEKILERNPLE